MLAAHNELRSGGQTIRPLLPFEVPAHGPRAPCRAPTTWIRVPDRPGAWHRRQDQHSVLRRPKKKAAFERFVSESPVRGRPNRTPLQGLVDAPQARAAAKRRRAIEGATCAALSSARTARTKHCSRIRAWSDSPGWCRGRSARRRRSSATGARGSSRRRSGGASRRRAPPAVAGASMPVAASARRRPACARTAARRRRRGPNSRPRRRASSARATEPRPAGPAGARLLLAQPRVGDGGASGRTRAASPAASGARSRRRARRGGRGAQPLDDVGVRGEELLAAQAESLDQPVDEEVGPRGVERRGGLAVELEELEDPLARLGRRAAVTRWRRRAR